jgi:hypothetical protein
MRPKHLVDWPPARRLAVALTTPATHWPSIGTRSIDLLSCPRDAWLLTGIRPDDGGPVCLDRRAAPLTVQPDHRERRSGIGALTPTNVEELSARRSATGDWASALKDLLPSGPDPAAFHVKPTGPASIARGGRQIRDGARANSAMPGASQPHHDQTVPVSQAVGITSRAGLSRWTGDAVDQPRRRVQPAGTATCPPDVRAACRTAGDGHRSELRLQSDSTPRDVRRLEGRPTRRAW